MPKNLSAQIRYVTIDKCLRDISKRYSLEALCRACGERLYEYLGIDKIPSERVLYEDIRIMKSGALGYQAPIKNVKISGENEFEFGAKKTSYYIYEDPEFSIFKFPLPSEDVDLLKQSLAILNQFKEFTFLKEIEGIITKLDKRINSIQKEKNIIGFEKIPNATGHFNIDELYGAILLKRPLEIHYLPFQSKVENVFEVHPYYLKEYRNRWYLYGFSIEKDGQQGIFPMGLDRITKIQELDKSFIPNTSFDPQIHFKNIIGITNIPESQPEEVILSFKPTRGKYVRSKPIHWTQEILVDDSKEFRISLNVIINKELIREILSFREDVLVIKPVSLINQIKHSLKNNLEMYEKKNKIFRKSR